MAVLGGAGVAAAVLFVLTVAIGTVRIPPAEVLRALLDQPTAEPTTPFLVRQLRLPKALTATLVGMAMGLAGLQMQTLFRNALAEPYLLGVNAGANLGVGLVTLGGAALAGAGVAVQGGVVVAASVGALATMAVMLLVAAVVRNAVIVVVIGVMVNDFGLAGVQLLVYAADPDSVKRYTDWASGSFGRVGWAHLPVLASAVLIGCGAATLLVKRLNLMLLGELYAESLGVSVRAFRWAAMGDAALLAGVVSAYAGPISFLGIAAPHLARAVLRTSDHRYLVPGSMLLGACVASVAALVTQLPGTEQAIPVNAALALFGAPVVAWLLLRMARTGRGLEA